MKKEFLKNAGFALWALCLLSLIQGCTFNQMTDLNLPQAESAWHEFNKISGQAASDSSPFQSTLTIRYRDPHGGYRMGAYLWSNSHKGELYPLRLDLQATLGSPLAKIREDKSKFLVFELENNIAHVSSNAQSAFMELGIPIPFNLKDITLLIAGRYAEVFSDFKTVKSKNFMPHPELIASSIKNESIFLLAPGRRYSGKLTLDALGRPTFWKMLEEDGWTLEISYDPDRGLPGPYQIHFEHSGGYSSTVVVKSIKKTSVPFTPSQLDLPIPGTAKINYL